MTALPPVRRSTLVSSYRDLSEKQIRARLEGTLTDVERVTAQAELLRRGIESDDRDTTPATGFAPTSGLDPVEATPAGAEPSTALAADKARRRRRAGIVAVILVIVCVALVVLSSNWTGR
jgi:hypothetical protein